MQQKMRGVVIHATKINDQKKIVELFTDTNGCVSFVVRIATGRNGGRNNSLYQPLSIIDFVTDIKGGSSLNYMKDIQMPLPFSSIPFNIYKTSIAIFLADFLHKALHIEYEDKSLFDFLVASIQWLDETTESIANFHLAFLMQISRYLGIFPNLNDYHKGDLFDLMNGCFTRQYPMHTYYLQADESRLLNYLMNMRYTNMNEFQLSRDQRMRCLYIMNDYYRLHIPGFPILKSLEILKTLFD